MRNAELALHFDELADLYELDGAIVHRVLAYRNAAKAIREAGASVAEMTKAGTVTELPGIGKTIEEKLNALLDTGIDPVGGEAEGQVSARPGRDHASAGPGAEAGAQALRRDGDRVARRPQEGGRGAAAPRAQGLRAEGGGEHPAGAGRRGGRAPQAQAAPVEGASDRRGAARCTARAAGRRPGRDRGQRQTLDGHVQGHRPRGDGRRPARAGGRLLLPAADRRGRARRAKPARALSPTTGSASTSGSSRPRTSATCSST